jgi:hypothetical protein
MIKAIAITAYCFIFLQGWFIGIPFIFYLLFSLTELWSVGSIAALFGLAGLILSGILWIDSKMKHQLLFELLALFLLLTPLIERLVHVPISTFNYPAFIIPVSFFLVFYILHFLLTTKFPDHKRNQL